MITEGGPPASGAPVGMGAHHDGSDLYVGDATPAFGDRVPIRVRVPRGSGVDAVYLRVVKDAEPVFLPAIPDGVEPTPRTGTRAEIAVHNPVTSYRVLLSRGRRGVLVAERHR